MRNSEEYRLRLAVAEAEESAFAVLIKGIEFETKVNVWSDWTFGSGHKVVLSAEKRFVLGGIDDNPVFRVSMTRRTEFCNLADGKVAEKGGRVFESWLKAFEAFKTETLSDPRFQLERPTSWVK